MKYLMAALTVYRGYGSNEKSVSATMVVALLFIIGGIGSYFGFSTPAVSQEQAATVAEHVNGIMSSAAVIVGVLFGYLRKRKDGNMRPGADHPKRRRADQDPEYHPDDYLG